MQTRYVLLLVAFAAGLAAIGIGSDARGQDREAARPAPRPDAPSGGTLGILGHGTWECALPGDAGGEAFIVVPEEGFKIGAASSYVTHAGGRGIYLLRGTEVVFTRGPKKDERFRVMGQNTLHKLNADGTESRMVCTRIDTTG